MCTALIYVTEENVKLELIWVLILSRTKKTKEKKAEHHRELDSVHGYSVTALVGESVPSNQMNVVPQSQVTFGCKN